MSATERSASGTSIDTERSASGTSIDTGTDAGAATATGTTVIRLTLPTHLRRLARVDGELRLDVPGPVTLGSVLDAVEELHPVLRGAIRDHTTGRRRPYVRFFACEQDLSHEPAGSALPPAVVRGDEPLLVVGAMAGG